jgi:hypothetical protein
MPPNARSRGYATLSVVSILTLIFSALALSSTRHVITDSHAMRNQLLAKRALAAADGGIDMAWPGLARRDRQRDRIESSAPAGGQLVGGLRPGDRPEPGDELAHADDADRRA